MQPADRDASGVPPAAPALPTDAGAAAVPEAVPVRPAPVVTALSAYRAGELELLELPAGPPSAHPSLDGWLALGDALWSADGQAIEGRVGGGGQSFLVSDGVFGDFELELQLRTLGPGNSGVQIRSQVRPDGRLMGYQIEVDPSERAWSGGLYDESRRGWLHSLAQLPEARAAFRSDDWNHYRIVCQGPWIRSWVNGVSAADLLDPLDEVGHLALQVHSGNDTHVLWRDLQLTDHGLRAWQRRMLSEEAERGLPMPYAHKRHWVTLEDAAGDGAWRFFTRGQGALLLVQRLTGNSVPRTLPQGNGAAIWAEPHGVFARLPLSMEPMQVALCTAGGRTALFVDGVEQARLDLPASVAVSGRLAVAVAGDGLMGRYEYLSEPQLRESAASVPQQ